MKHSAYTLMKPHKNEPNQNTKEACAERQSKIDTDTAAFLSSGGKITRIKPV